MDFSMHVLGMLPERRALVLAVATAVVAMLVAYIVMVPKRKMDAGHVAAEAARVTDGNAAKAPVPLQADASVVEVPRDGISLSAIDGFIAHCGGEEKLGSRSTAEVCADFLKPLTSSTGLSYCAEQAGSTGAVGPATVFVSHAWAFSFMSVVRALRHWAAKQPAAEPIFFWFDIFSNSQHETATRPFLWWTTVFAENVRGIGHTLLVLEFLNPLPLKRAWCLCEIAATVSAGKLLEVVMNGAEEEAFRKALLTDYPAVVRALCFTDLQLAQASIEADRNKILEAVSAQPGGISGTNAEVICAMRRWMEAESTKLLAQARAGDAGANARNTLAAVAHFFYGQGKLVDAEGIFREALALDATDAAVLSGLAAVLTDRGNDAEAEALFNHAKLALLEAPLLPRVELAIATARQLDFAKRHKEASIILRALVSKLSSESTATAAALRCRCEMRLAICLRGQGSYEEALRILTNAEPAFLGVFGPRHPETLEFFGALSWSVGKVAGREVEAEKRLREAAAKSAEILGELHHVTLRNAANLCEWLLLAGRPADAEKLCETTLQRRLALYGAKHRAVARTTALRQRIAAALTLDFAAAEPSFVIPPVTESSAAIDSIGSIEDNEMQDRFTSTFIGFIGSVEMALELHAALIEAKAVIAGGACTAAACGSVSWSGSDIDIWVPGVTEAGLMAFFAAHSDFFKIGVSLTRREARDNSQHGLGDDGHESDYGFSGSGRLSKWVTKIYEVHVKPVVGSSDNVLQVLVLLPMSHIIDKDGISSYLPVTPHRVVESFDLTCVQVMAEPVSIVLNPGRPAFRLSGPGLLDARAGRASWGKLPLEELRSLELSAVLDWRRTLIRGVKYASRGFDVEFSGWLEAWTSWASRHCSFSGDFQPTGWLGTGELAASLAECRLSTRVDASSEVCNVCCALFLACRSSSAHVFIPRLIARLIFLGGVPPSAASWWDDALVRAAAIGASPPLNAPASLGGTGPSVVAEAMPWSWASGMIDPSRVSVILLNIDNSGLVRPRVVALKAVKLEDSDNGFFSFVQPQKPIERRVAHGTDDACVDDAPLLGEVWASFVDWASPPAEHMTGKPSSDALPRVVLVAYNGWGFDFPVLLTDLARVGCEIPDRWRLCSLAYELRMRPGCMHPDFCVSQPSVDEQQRPEGPLPAMPYRRLADLYKLLHEEAMRGAEDAELPFDALADVRGMAKCVATAARTRNFALSWRHTQSFAHASSIYASFTGFKVAASDAIVLPDELPLSRILGVGAVAARWGAALTPPNGPVRVIADLRRIYTELNLGASPGAAERWAHKSLGVRPAFVENVVAQMLPLAAEEGAAGGT